MTENQRLRSIQISLSILTFIAVVAAMKLSSSILIPFLLSAFIATVSAPAMFWLTSKKVPTTLALLIVIAMILIAGFGVVALIGSSVDSFTKDLPVYEEKLQGKVEQVQGLLNQFGVAVTKSDIQKIFDPGAAMNLVAKTLNGLGSALTNGFMILLTVIFILLEATSFPIKLREILGDNVSSMEPFDRFREKVKRYMAIKTFISIGTGVIVMIMLMILGVSYPILWGFLAFLLNYIPNIGSIIAAVPPVLLALIHLGTGEAIIVAVGFVVINLVAGNVVEPKFMGKELGLSTLVVFLSLLFWGWVLGPVGMLLSVPLTITVKIAMGSSNSLRWVSVLLGPEK